jgi:hypothetical protein
MATSFGALETCGPTRRTFSPGVFATKRFTSISGAGSTRLYGSKATAAELSLTFLANDNDVNAFFKCWYDAYGDYDVLDLPPEFFEGSSPILDSGVPEYLNWRWADAPSVESLFPGKSRVQVKFTATLDI